MLKGKGAKHEFKVKVNNIICFVLFVLSVCVFIEILNKNVALAIPFIIFSGFVVFGIFIGRMISGQ